WLSVASGWPRRPAAAADHRSVRTEPRGPRIRPGASLYTRVLVPSLPERTTSGPRYWTQPHQTATATSFDGYRSTRACPYTRILNRSPAQQAGRFDQSSLGAGPAHIAGREIGETIVRTLTARSAPRTIIGLLAALGLVAALAMPALANHDPADGP